MTFSGYEFNNNLPSHLFLVELARSEKQLINPFGGNSDLAIKDNIWIPAGEAVDFSVLNVDKTLSVKYLHGD